MGLITTQMEIDMRVTGIVICRTEQGPITTPTEIFSKGTGSMVSKMEKETISIKKIELSIKDFGKKERKRGLENLSLKTSMDIQDNGETIRNRVRVPTYIIMGKDTRVSGSKTKNTETVVIDTRMGILTTEVGRMIIDMEKELCSTTTELSTQVSGRRASSMVKV